MTPEQIDQLEAGQDMNCLIAPIMGLTMHIFPDTSGRWENAKGESVILPNYSTDIAAAWLVVEKMKEQGFSVQVGANPDEFKYECALDRKGLDIGVSRQESAPVAICRAALKAVMGGNDEA